MNSYAEHVIMTTINYASTILLHTDIVEDFWALAAKDSVYLLNQSLHLALNDCTPYEMWHPTKPHI